MNRLFCVFMLAVIVASLLIGGCHKSKNKSKHLPSTAPARATTQAAGK